MFVVPATVVSDNLHSAFRILSHWFAAGVHSELITREKIEKVDNFKYSKFTKSTQITYFTNNKVGTRHQ